MNHDLVNAGWLAWLQTSTQQRGSGRLSYTPSHLDPGRRSHAACSSASEALSIASTVANGACAPFSPPPGTNRAVRSQSRAILSDSSPSRLPSTARRSRFSKSWTYRSMTPPSSSTAGLNPASPGARWTKSRSRSRTCFVCLRRQYVGEKGEAPLLGGSSVCVRCTLRRETKRTESSPLRAPPASSGPSRSPRPLCSPFPGR